jgi:hypothetical protein
LQVASNTSNNSYGIRQLYHKHLLDYELACAAKQAAEAAAEESSDDSADDSDMEESDEDGEDEAVEAAEILESLLGLDTSNKKRKV